MGDVAETTGADLQPDDDLKEQVLAELQEEQAVQTRLALVKERNPSVYSRLMILGSLFQLQEGLGGEFPQSVTWLHTADNIFNLRRIGNVDFDTLTVALEVYEYSEIVPGIVFLPVDHVCWAGTTDRPYGDQHVGWTDSGGTRGEPPANYQTLRRKIAGLDAAPQAQA